MQILLWSFGGAELRPSFYEGGFGRILGTEGVPTDPPFLATGPGLWYESDFGYLTVSHHSSEAKGDLESTISPGFGVTRSTWSLLAAFLALRIGSFHS